MVVGVIENMPLNRLSSPLAGIFEPVRGHGLGGGPEAREGEGRGGALRPPPFPRRRLSEVAPPRFFAPCLVSFFALPALSFRDVSRSGRFLVLVLVALADTLGMSPMVSATARDVFRLSVRGGRSPVAVALELVEVVRNVCEGCRV